MSSLPALSPPLHFVRIAGLPVDAVAPFASPLLEARLAAIAVAEEQLAAARAALVDALFPLIHGAEPAVRHFLLAVKRDAYNGRPVAGHARREAWESWLGAAAPAATTLLESESAAAAAFAAFAQAHREETERQLRELPPPLAEGRIRRALALSSPLAAGQLAKLGEGPGLAARREKRAAESALRYLSRAALKLSPFSAFTPLALGVADPAAGELTLTSAEIGETALLRVQPAFLDQVGALLLAFPAFQAGLAAEVNPTLEPLEGGLVRWFRPGHWLFDPAQSGMSYTSDAFLKSPLKDPVLARLTAEPGALGVSLAALAERLAAELPELGAAGVAARLERLRVLGFLLLRLPWASNAPRREAAMAAALIGAADDRLAELGAALGRLVADEDALAEAGEPAPALRGLDREVDQVWSLARALVPGAGQAGYVRIKENQFFDDVWRYPAEAPETPLLRLPGRQLAGFAAAVAPLLDLASLADLRFDFLHHLDRLLLEIGGESGEAGVFALFERAKPLFHAFSELEKLPERPELWNPGDLPEVATLAELRRLALAAADAAVFAEGELAVIDPARLAAAAELVPAVYRCPVGPCLFLQPTGEGERWVANRIYEGTGRYSSRYTALLPPPLYRRFATPWIAAGREEGEGAALVDLIHSQGDTLNVHRALTARLLVHPGDRVDSGEGHEISLAEVRVRRRPGGPPELVDGQGRRCLPVQLGGAARRFLPILFRFLSCFGPSELAPRLPAAILESAGDATVRRRLVLGELVLLRRRWIFEQEKLPSELFAAPEAEAFRAIDAWRRRHGMPDRVFLIENVHHPTRRDLYKPQYLDLGSPLFVALLRAALKHHNGVVSFEEMLPLPEAAPRDPAGRGWLVEVMAERPAPPKS